MPLASSTSRRIRVLGALVAAGATACLTPTDTCACSYPPPYSLLVAGTVTQASGAAAAGVPVGARVFSGTCAASDAEGEDVTGGVGASDAAGRFRLEMRTLLPLDTTCLRVRAFRVSPVVGTPPDTLATVERPGVRVREQLGGRPADSVTVALALP